MHNTVRVAPRSCRPSRVYQLLSAEALSPHSAEPVTNALAPSFLQSLLEIYWGCRLPSFTVHCPRPVRLHVTGIFLPSHTLPLIPQDSELGLGLGLGLPLHNLNWVSRAHTIFRSAPRGEHVMGVTRLDHSHPQRPRLLVGL